MPPTQIVELGREQCLQLLQHEAFVGRVAFSSGDVLQLRPVNYVADERGIVFCTASAAILEAVASGAAVVFEVDASHPMEHGGWSVIVRGGANEITDAEDLEYLRRGPLKSWAVSPRERWVRVQIGEISGVRIPGR